MKTFFPQKPLLITLEQPLFKELELRQDCVAEKKYNGTRLVLKRFADHYEFWNRSGEVLKYNPPKELIDQLNKVAWEGTCIADGELLHFKTKHIKNTIVLFDLLLWNDESVTEKPFIERRALLEKACGDLFVAPQFKGGTEGCFRNMYDTFTKLDEIEGIVMKSLGAKHKLGRTESPVVAWNWKVRKPGPSYRGGENWRHDDD